MENPKPQRPIDGMSTPPPRQQTSESPGAAGGYPQWRVSQDHPYDENDQVYGPGEDLSSIDMDIATDAGDARFKFPAYSKRNPLAWWKKALLGMAAATFVLVAGVGGVFWYLQNNIIVDNTGQGAASLQGEVNPDMLEGEGDGRINGLLIGTDIEDGGRADTIILVSFDPVAKDVTMLSVPRDLYVDIDNFGTAKINAAHVYGDEYGYDGGGPGLLQDTVSEVLDVPVHYYARADFDGFKQGIDALGGITVDVEEPLVDPHFPDDERSGYDPLRIEAGEQVMDGETALRYARSRKTTSDFDRSRRQQEVLLGAREQVLSSDTLGNPARISRLLGSLGSSLETNMSVDEMVRLSELAEEVSSDDIIQERLEVEEKDSLLSFSNIRGQSVIVPSAGNFNEVQEYVRTLLVDGYIKDENAKVSVLNGTYRPALAEETAALLRSYGYNVVNIDNAPDQDYEQSVIFTYGSDNPYTLRFLENRFGVGARHGEPGDEEFDIEIVIGGNYTPDAITE